jgi:formate hydrogenlyase transcriptional activator
MSGNAYRLDELQKAATNGALRTTPPSIEKDQVCCRRVEQPSDRALVGDSAALQRVLQQVNVVASTDATVLIEGESGTGKELIARMIHTQGSRHGHAFVSVNCAAIPLGLLESELFGHERGAFTGAIAQRLGRFEAADHGTLFLDEIGDIPQELQPKLLRVLQDQQFERLGSARTIRTNVRLIAATHRNLTQMIDSGGFRLDLYYRLRVFPISVPPLRNRREDIPPLVWHFVRRYADQMGRRIETIPPDIMHTLSQHSWRGNIRELQNFIERAVILSRGSVLEAPVWDLVSHDESAEPVTLRDAERTHILRILREVDGVISAAAARLGVPRTTLFYKMRRLGIGQPRLAPQTLAHGGAESYAR